MPDSVINQILTTATYAPSAHNRQPWRFCVVKDNSIKSRLADAMTVEFKRELERDGISPEKVHALVNRSKERTTSAPVLVIICLEMGEMDLYPDTKRTIAEYTMGVQSAANAGMQLLLAAHAEGLGGVWVCSPLFVPETVRNILNLPKSWGPQGMFYVGFPKNIPEVRERKHIDEITIRI